MSRCHFERVSLSMDANLKLLKLFPFVNMAEKYGGVP